MPDAKKKLDPDSKRPARALHQSERNLEHDAPDHDQETGVLMLGGCAHAERDGRRPPVFSQLRYWQKRRGPTFLDLGCTESPKVEGPDTDECPEDQFCLE
eukprot:CAMPEP_0118930812 /NCGR_PEP_ID=MMETSP1169-20130426/7376_1 /TAXON_ID=36882 /ORGANISM="Pyramimonas obovata, Strain CCMP722" /LENGTH=99 /DNA_ID=CAMNT_0006873227 /DNA_START=1582 /DNA_END=1882 /DNA_ORIENTATION=+